jgi:hypothetical protein
LSCVRPHNNHMLKDLIGELAESLWPASIRDYNNIVKAVVASAIDVNPRTLGRAAFDLA